MQVAKGCCTEEGTKQVCVMKGVAGDSCGEVYEEGEETGFANNCEEKVEDVEAPESQMLRTYARPGVSER